MIFNGQKPVPVVTPLAIVSRLSHELDQRGVRYCHWKSNEHIDAAVLGDTDLDVLFDEASETAVHQALDAAGFVEFKAVWFRRYPFITDYLGIDSATGKLVHVHTHFRLLLGESGVKSFRVPWEEQILATRHRDEATGFFSCEPTLELVLLIVRASIKARFKTPFQRRKRRGSSQSDDEREFVWLKARTSLPEVTELARKLIGDTAAAEVARIFSQGISQAGLISLYGEIADRAKSWRRYSAARAVFERWRRRVIYLVTLSFNRLGWRRLPQKRTAIGPGLIVAVMGADGSGKTTLNSNLMSRLSGKLDTCRIYLGSGVGASSWHRAPLIRIRRALGSRGPAKLETIRLSPSPAGRSILQRVADTVWATSLAVERRAKLRQASRARQQGMLILTDRYLQAQVEGYNDGPLMGSLRRSNFPPARWLGDWERSIYMLDGLPKPDLVLKLVGDPKVLYERRRDMEISAIELKQAGITAASWQGAKMKVLSAEESPDGVARLAMMEIARSLKMKIALNITD